MSTSDNEKMMDLMYFGYTWEPESIGIQKEFIESITKVFPEVELQNAFDHIKGYRQSVYLPQEQADNYYSWLIGEGWFEMSLHLRILFLDKNKKHEFDRLVNLAKSQYPESFNKECKDDENQSDAGV